MDRLIGKEVQLKTNDKGTVEKITKSDSGYNIVIRYGDVEKLYSFKTAVEKGTIVFVDKLIQEFAENKARSIVILPPTPPKPRREMITHFTVRGENFGAISKLNYGFNYGTNAMNIYDRCCKAFQWPTSARGNFSMMKKLYAYGVADGCSVWFLNHNNITETESESGKWRNYIFNDDTIEEEHLDHNEKINLGDTRIVFIKNKEPGYIFAGIYQQEMKGKNEKKNTVLIYRLIEKDFTL